MLFFQYLGLKNTKIHPNSFNYIKYEQLDQNLHFIKLKPTLYLKNRLEGLGLSRRRVGAGDWRAGGRLERADGLLECAEGRWECARGVGV